MEDKVIISSRGNYVMLMDKRYPRQVSNEPSCFSVLMRPLRLPSLPVHSGGTLIAVVAVGKHGDKDNSDPAGMGGFGLAGKCAAIANLHFAILNIFIT